MAEPLCVESQMRSECRSRMALMSCIGLRRRHGWGEIVDGVHGISLETIYSHIHTYRKMNFICCDYLMERKNIGFFWDFISNITQRKDMIVAPSS